MRVYASAWVNWRILAPRFPVTHEEILMNLYAKLLFVFALGTLGAAGASAEELTGTLKKIKDTGTISLGHRESSIPFSYYDDKQQVVGYSHEIMLKVVDAVKQELKLPKLDVKLTPITSQNRISLIQNGTIDIECESTTNNTDRQKQVAFSN